MTPRPDITAVQPIILTLIGRLLPNLRTHDRDDLVQDVNLHILERIDRFDASKAAFTTWCWQVARNAIIDHARQRRQPVQDVSEIDPAAPEPEPAGAELPEPDISTLTEKQRALWERLRQGQQPAAIDKAGNYSLNKKRSRSKIDGIAAALMALLLHMKGKADQPADAYYERNDLITLDW